MTVMKRKRKNSRIVFISGNTEFMILFIELSEISCAIHLDMYLIHQTLCMLWINISSFYCS